MKQYLILFPALLALLLFGCAKNGPAEGTKTTAPTDAVSGVGEASATEEEATTQALVWETDGFAVSNAFAYAGAYLEDGSNEEVSNVAAVRVENRTGKAIRSVDFTVTTDAGELRFVCTTLLPGRGALLLEQNRVPYTGASVVKVTVSGVVDFEEAPTLYPDVFSVGVNGHVMTLRNLTSNPVSGEIYVYYKRADAQGYLGGITYRVRFADLPGGAEASASSRNLTEQDCDILFIGCENPPEVTQ